MRLLLSALLSVTLAGFAALPSASGDAFLEQDPIVCEAADEEELPCAFGDDKICPGVQCPGGTGSDGGKSEEGAKRGRFRGEVIGRGEYSVKAEKFTLRFTIENFAETEETARELSAKTKTSVLQAFPTSACVREEDCYVYRQAGEMRGVVVGRRFAVDGKDCVKAEEYRTKVFSLGADYVCAPEYFAGDPKTCENEALRLAVENATSKASALGIPVACYSVRERPCFCSPRTETNEGGEVQVVFFAVVAVSYFE